MLRPENLPDRLVALLDKMKSRRIVVVGDAMLDVYLQGDTERISPEAPVPVITVHARRHALGGAANVAANVAATGAECRLVAVVGDDERGDSVRAELVQHRLTDRHIVSAPARPTTSKTRVVARGQQVVRIDEEVDDPIPTRTEEIVVEQLQRAMDEADALKRALSKLDAALGANGHLRRVHATATIPPVSRIRSPTWKGRVVSRTSPAKTLPRVCCAARPSTTAVNAPSGMSSVSRVETVRSP